MKKIRAQMARVPAAGGSHVGQRPVEELSRDALFYTVQYAITKNIAISIIIIHKQLI